MSENKDNGKEIFVGGNSEQGVKGDGDGNRFIPNQSTEKFGLKSIKSGLQSSAKDFTQDLSKSLKTLKDGAISSLKDRFLGSNKRNGNTDVVNFVIQEKNTSNRHSDVISGILKDTYNGNLFDAGLSALQLYNFGTKWRFIMDQYVDKSMYPFRYWYYFENYEKENSNLEHAEEDLSKFYFLETIEDPTILGYSFKIDYSNSTLFGTSNGASIGQAEEDVPTSSSSIINKFINEYSAIYPEMAYCKTLLSEFTNDIKRIFEMPDSLDTNEYKNTLYKNHYIARVDGLDKLDNLFVDYTDDPQSLTIQLNEDVRMFTNRLAFLYRNLTYSYNMGKKLIPENLLRFNLYIKIADYRNFTRNTTANVDKLKESMRDGFSQVIYELKDCEFVFDKSLNPGSLQLGGVDGDVNKSYANLEIKIKYRKVNRIFYSTMFSSNFNEMIIGDALYSPSTSLYKTMYNKVLPDSSKFKKREATSNNIPVTPTIKERFDSLKNNGLLTPDNDDSALTRFAKTITNDAVKAGAQVVDEGLKSIKNQVNDFTTKNSLRNLLQAKVISKIKKFNLGDRNSRIDETPAIKYKDLQPTGNMIVREPTGDLHPTSNSRIISPVGDLHQDVNISTNIPNEILHQNTNNNVIPPNGDLHPNLNVEMNEPTGDLHPTINNNIKEPFDNLHPDNNDPIVQPDEDLHLNTDDTIISPVDDLHGVINQNITQPNEDLHINIDDNINNPNSILHQNSGNVISMSDKNINNTTDNNIIEIKKTNINSENISNISSPNTNINTNSDDLISDPNNNINTNTETTITQPKGNINPETNHHIKKSDKYTDLKDYLKKKPDPNSEIE